MAGEANGDGSVVALWRYPVKSMLGEELNATVVGERGVAGDRAHALIDLETGAVASAKQPRKWGRLFDFRAAYVDAPGEAGSLPPVRLTFPDGRAITTRDPDVHERLSAELQRKVFFASQAPDAPKLEEYWPDIEGLALRETVTEEAMPEGTFFDLAVIHLLTTATIDRLRQLHPPGRFEARRFRPNLVVEWPADEPDFAESRWEGRTVAVGDEVRLKVTGPCPRCVMTTLPQGDLPRDGGVLRTALRSNAGHVGAYAAVEHGGTVRRGDRVRLV
jgi:uncharacterized protein YcbX